MQLSPRPPASDRGAEPWQAENGQLLDLIVRARHGDSEAFGDLYDRTARWLLSHVRRFVDDGQAEDVLADVFIQVWKSLSTYDPALAPPGVWLAMIARSRALDHLRREKRAAQVLGEVQMENVARLDSPEGPEQLLSRAQQSRLVQLSLGNAGLTPDERTVLGLAYFRDSTQQEIAALTGWPLGTVKTIMVRAQQKVRAAVSAVPGS